MKFNSYIILLSAITLLLWSCQDYEEINENPNEPTEVSGDVLLNSAIQQSTATLTNESFLLGNNIAQLSAKALRTEVDEYTWNAFPTVWEGLYESLTDINALERKAMETNNPALEATALIMKSLVYSTLTNAYGDIPFTEAIKGGEIDPNFNPVYDRQQDIYDQLLDDLARADQMLASGEGVIPGDILFNRDTEKWRRFGNSLRLRLLLYANQKIDGASDQIASIISEGMIMQSNEDNATLTYTNSFPNQFPLIPIKTGDFDAVAFSQTALDVMEPMGDPRLMRYARPNNDTFTSRATFTGAENGRGTLDCNKSGSRLGVQYYNYPDLATATELGLPQAEGLLMTYSEVAFIVAEAAVNGWVAEDPANWYRQAVKASMDYYQVDYGPFGYTGFDDFYDRSGIAYATESDIWEQKWVALFFTGLEPYFELRRWYIASGGDWNNLPFIDAPCSNVNNDQLPMRFLYPGEEQSLNTTNYLEAVSRLGENDKNARMWLVSE